MDQETVHNNEQTLDVVTDTPLPITETVKEEAS